MGEIKEEQLIVKKETAENIVFTFKNNVLLHMLSMG